MSATDTLPPLVPLSQKPTRIIKARPPNRPPPHLPPKPPQKPPPPAPKNHPPFAKSDVGGPRSDVTGPRSDVGGPRSDVSGPRSDVTGPRSDVGGPRSDVGGPRSDVGGPRSDVGGPRSDVGGPRSDVGGPRSDVMGPRSDVMGPRSDVTGHRSDVGGPRSDVMGPRTGMGGLRSDVRGPRSDVGGPRSDVTGHRSDVGGPRSDVMGPRSGLRSDLGPRSDVGGPRSDVGGPRSDVGGPRSDVGGPRSDAMGGLRSDLGPRSDVGGPRTDLSNPKNHSVIPAARSDVETPDNVVDNRLLPGVCVKKMAGLFQKEPVGGASDDPQPVGPPKPTVGPSREEKVLPQMEENTMQVAAELMEEEEPCPPPLPPKNVQDPDVRATKMGSCPPLPACPARCRCACHLQRPGMVLVWLPESFILRSRNLSEASDSSDDGGVIHRTLPASEGAEDRGKWGPWSLKNKMVSGGTYSRRRRSLRSSEYLMEGPRVMEAKPGVVLTSYKSTNDSSFEGGSDSSPPDSASKLNGEATESELRSLSTNSAEQSETSHTDSAPPLPQSEAPPLRSHRFRAEFSGESLELLPQCSNPPAPEDLDSDPSALRDSTEDVSAAESRAKVRKPARRSKVPPLALLPVEEKTALVPPKVPSKPPRWAAPPPPPFVRKGSLKRYSAGNSEEVEQREEESSSTLATMYLPSENCPSEGQESCGADTADCAHEIYRGGSIFMSPPVRSPKSIDWESHLRDEPLYQTYRQAVIKKELRRQTVPRNSSFTSYDSSHDSPLSSGGSPKQGRRSAASHNTLWQELPAVKESGVLGDMSNEEKKMQESMFEVLTSEASYLRSLNVLIEHFMESRELDDTLIVREKKILFSNVLKVKEVSERFLMDLEDRVEENIIITDVCDIIYQHALHHFPVYIDYVRNQVFQEKTYSELLEKNPQFHATLCRLQELPQCQRLPFMSFLLLPFQRITRIKMLIENILKRTEEASEMEQNATNALDSVSKIIQECNREVGRMKQTEELIHIAQKIVFDKIKAVPIISQNRFLEKQGELSEVLQKGSLFGIKPTKFTPVYFFLFNDFLLLTQKKSSDKYVVLDYAHHSLVQVQTSPTMENSFFLTLLENHQGKMCERLYKASTQSDLHRWVAAFPNLADDSLSGSDTIYEDWDCPQVQCIEPYTASQADELNLEPVDIINVLKKTSEGWYEGIRLSDGKKGWFPSLYVQEITNEHVRRRNLRERHRVLQAARQIHIKRFGEPRKKTSSA